MFNSNYLEQKGNVMALIATIAHMPEGIAAERTRTSHPGKGLRTSGLSYSSELLSLLGLC